MLIGIRWNYGSNNGSIDANLTKRSQAWMCIPVIPVLWWGVGRVRNSRSVSLHSEVRSFWGHMGPCFKWRKNKENREPRKITFVVVSRQEHISLKNTPKIFFKVSKKNNCVWSQRIQMRKDYGRWEGWLDVPSQGCSLGTVCSKCCARYFTREEMEAGMTRELRKWPSNKPPESS